MVDVLTQTLHKEPCGSARRMGAVHENARLRLAAQAAGAAVFDWHVADGTIVLGRRHRHPAAVICDSNRAQALLDGVARRKAAASCSTSWNTLALCLATSRSISKSPRAMGAVSFTMAGTRVAGEDGRTERADRHAARNHRTAREIQRLTYLATRDELTGHLNRNALRDRTAQAIDTRQGGKPPLRLPGRLDRPAGHDQ